MKSQRPLKVEKDSFFFFNWIPSKCHGPVWILVNLMVFEKYLFEFSSSVRLPSKTTSRNWSVVAYKVQVLLFCLKYFFFFSTESKTEIAHYYWPKWPGRKFLPLFFQRGGAHSSGPRELKDLLDSEAVHCPFLDCVWKCLREARAQSSMCPHLNSPPWERHKWEKAKAPKCLRPCEYSLSPSLIFSLSPGDK